MIVWIAYAIIMKPLHYLQSLIIWAIDAALYLQPIWTPLCNIASLPEHLNAIYVYRYS